MKPALEKTIERRVVEWAIARGFLAPKVTFTEAGWPDRMFVSPYGHTIFIEFKRPGGKPDPQQVYRIRELQKRGVPAFWVDTYEAAVEILTTALESQTVSEEGHTTPAGPTVSGTISGSRLGQDVDGPRYDKDPVGPEPYTEGPNCGPVASSPDGLAGRNREMGGLPPPTVDGSAWDPEGC